MAGLRSFDFCDSLAPSHGGPQTATSPSAEQQDVKMALLGYYGLVDRLVNVLWGDFID